MGILKKFSQQNLKARVFVVIVLIAVIILAYFFLSGGFKQFKTPEEEARWRETQESKIASIIKSGNISSCDRIAYQSADNTDYKTVCRNNIVMAQAEKALDVSLCKNLDDNLFSIQSCEETVINKKLSQGGNVTFCASLGTPENRKYCEDEYWFREALDKKDASICKNISESKRKTCEDNFLVERIAKGEKVDCTLLSPVMRTSCNSFYSAVESTDAVTKYLTCSGLVNPMLRSACLEFKK